MKIFCFLTDKLNYTLEIKQIILIVVFDEFCSLVTNCIEMCMCVGKKLM